jgi:hypothetical protein
MRENGLFAKDNVSVWSCFPNIDNMRTDIELRTTVAHFIACFSLCLTRILKATNFQKPSSA